VKSSLLLVLWFGLTQLLKEEVVAQAQQHSHYRGQEIETYGLLQDD
jgi:hypothetical protein